jgi:PAS domain S-box-containing protein
MSASRLVGSYDYRLVALSVLVSILAAYAARDLSARVSARGRAWLAWLAGAATADGIGTWSMHYTGMLAYRLPIPVKYDWPTVLLSLAVGIIGSAASLLVVSHGKWGWPRALAASFFLGGVAISGLHYTAMAAMRLQAMHHYSPVLATLSIVLAILIPLTFLGPEDPPGRKLRPWRAVLRGAANPVMHYTAMAALSVTYSGEVPDLSHAVSISFIDIFGFSVVPVMLLVVALLTSVVDRLQKQRALLDELFEEVPQAVALLGADDRVVRVNKEFTRLFGYTPQETLGRRLQDLIVPEEAQDKLPHCADLVARGQRVDSEGLRRRKDGTRLHVAMDHVPVSLPGGQIAIYAIYRDITERNRAEQERQGSLEQLRALAARLQSIREEERTRVAREIHDELGQALTAIKIDLAALISALPPDLRQQSGRVESVLKLVDETIQSVRRISTQLRPGVLDDLGLVAAIEWAAEEFEARTGTKCRLDLPQDDIVIDRERATALFRIFQETLTNVARHAKATQVDARLAQENGDLFLEIRDNGTGISEERLSAGASLGILGMRERALLLGGELTISGVPGKGTVVMVRIPQTPGTELGKGK